MASSVIGVKPGKRGSLTADSNGFWIYNETLIYRVLADTNNASTSAILMSTTGLPVIGVTAIGSGPFAAIALATPRRTATQDPKAPRYWDVEQEFSNTPPKPNEPDQDGDPAEWTPIAEYTMERRQAVRWRAKKWVSGEWTASVQPVVTPAGELYSDPVMYDILVTGFKFTQYETSFTDATVRARNGKTNLTEFNGYPMDTLLCEIESAVPVTKNGFVRVAVKYHIRYTPERWIATRLRWGTYYLESGDKLYFRDAKENPMDSGLLTDAGARKAGYPDNDDFDEWQQYDQIEFSDFLRV